MKQISLRITVCLLCFFGTSTVSLFGSEIIIKPYGIAPTRGDIDIQFVFSQKSDERVYIPKFNWRFSYLILLVDEHGTFYPNQRFIREGTNKRVPFARSSFSPNPSDIMSAGFNLHSNSSYQINQAGHFYFLVLMRKPFRESGVILSAPCRMSVNSKREIVSLCEVGKHEMPLNVIRTLQKETTRILLEQGFTKEDVPNIQ